MVCVRDWSGETSGGRVAAMDQKQSTPCSDGRRSVSWNGGRVRSTTSQPQRRNNHAHLVPGRRADEDAQDDHPASHHIQPHLRYSSWLHLVHLRD